MPWPCLPGHPTTRLLRRILTESGGTGNGAIFGLMGRNDGPLAALHAGSPTAPDLAATFPANRQIFFDGCFRGQLAFLVDALE